MKTGRPTFVSFPPEAHRGFSGVIGVLREMPLGTAAGTVALNAVTYADTAVRARPASDVPATRLGVTNPAEWSLDSWASDVVPRLVFGLTTALAYDFLADV